MKTYAYTATISNAGTARADRLVRDLKNFPKYADAWIQTDCTVCGSDKGSICFAFVMDAQKANALRKWFMRRGKGRAKFSRHLDPLDTLLVHAPAA
jgi:hypothetical protein